MTYVQTVCEEGETREDLLIATADARERTKC